MRPGHPQICLFQPEIPQNTGSIARLAAACCCRLHIVKPTGFGLSDKNLRRPGLDYWPYLDLEIWDNIEPLIQLCQGKVAFFSKFSDRPYYHAPTTTELFVFGRETAGLPQELHRKYADCIYTIPMFHSQVRSLNLANAVSIVTYDQLARRGLFEGRSWHGNNQTKDSE